MLELRSIHVCEIIQRPVNTSRELINFLSIDMYTYSEGVFCIVQTMMNITAKRLRTMKSDFHHGDEVFTDKVPSYMCVK